MIPSLSRDLPSEHFAVTAARTNAGKSMESVSKHEWKTLTSAFPRTPSPKKAGIVMCAYNRVNVSDLRQ